MTTEQQFCIATTIQEAIARSRSNNSIVRVTLAGDITTITEYARDHADNVDCVRESDGSFDVWGWSDEMTSENEMEWRLNVTIAAAEIIRYSENGSVSMVWANGEPVRCPTQHDMDTLPVGDDMSDDELAQLQD